MSKKMKGVWVHEKTQTLKEFDIPEPKEGQVLIKVEAAAQNPKDWKGKILIINCDFNASAGTFAHPRNYSRK